MFTVLTECLIRIDYGRKYCKNSPSIEESRLHNAIAEAITERAASEQGGYERIVSHIEMYKMREDSSGIIERQERIAEIEKVIDDLAKLNKEEAQNGELDDRFDELYSEMYLIKDELAEMQKSSISQLDDESLNEIRDVIAGLKNHPVEYDDKIVRSFYDKIYDKESIRVI